MASRNHEPNPIEGGCVRCAHIVMGMLANNVYLIDDGDGGVAVVDPCKNADAVLATVETFSPGARVSALLCTHGHWDHVGALADLRRVTGAKVYAAAADAEWIENRVEGAGRRNVAPCPVDVKVEDGQRLMVGAIAFTVMTTPGHSKGSVCYLVAPDDGSAPGAPVLFSGDTLFAGCTGRTDFEGGDAGQMRASLDKLATLDDATLVLPGHNETSTIGAERTRVLQAFRP